MRRSLLFTSVITAAALVLTGASTCGPQGPAARDFAAGSLVIPMDGCYQKRSDSNGTSGGQTIACNTTADDGVFRAYGLVYFLLKNNVTVYWAIDNTKITFTAADLTVSAPAGGGAAVQKMNWADGTFADLAGAGTNAIKYVGGPFVIDAGDAPTALALFKTAQFAQFNPSVDVHKIQTLTHATQVRTLTGPPPKIAILNIAGPKTSADVMIKYAKAAGFDWTCNGACTAQDGSDCDCAGGISKLDPNCTKASIASSYGITVNNGPGKVYDILCDKDFLPDYTANPPDFSKATLLAKDGVSYRYKLLWAPHWETPRATCPQGTVNPSGKTVACGTTPDPAAAVGTASRNLADWLACIRAFVDAGNNLFAECHAIVTLEGGYGLIDTANPIKEYGLPITRFQTTAGMNRGLSVAIGASGVTEAVPTEPYMQIADYTFSVTNGNVSAFYADPAGNSTFGLAGSSYDPTATRYIDQSSGTPALDVMMGLKYGGESSNAGAVIYMGGHDYSPQTAGTRIVLNTLFNLGFGCADPGTTCTTGLLGACATGTLKCAGGGGLQCVGPAPGAVDCVTPNADANCNGIPDAQEAACAPTTCTEGATLSCWDGPAAADPGTAPGAKKGICQRGVQTCIGGAWTGCVGEVLPQPEVCNGLDDNCDGNVDEGSLCGLGSSCQSGICLPTSCNTESARCPTGFTCDATSKCAGVPCPTAACPAGQECLSGACKNPCDGVKCGPGSSCSGGQCVAGGCALDPTLCSGAQVCVQGTCVSDPCAPSAITCPQGTFCRVGPMVNGTYVADCVRSCSYTACPPGQSCGEDGFCQADCNPACGAGQVCLQGACAPDPCLNVTCGAGQECSAGACVDVACKHVRCDQGTCSGGQCVVTGITPTVQSPIRAASGGGGGCGTGGSGGGLASLALLAAALLARRGARAPVAVRVPVRVRGAARRALPLALVALLASGAACSKSSGGATSCSSGQSACGADCVDLQTSTVHCGACGTGCGSGFQCTAGACVFPTGNPHLTSVQPTTIGRGVSPALQFTFDGLSAQPTSLVVRLTGAVEAQELPLTLDATGHATLPTGQLDVQGETTGTIEARLLNMPGRLLSNALPISVTDKLVVRAVTPALVRQDQPVTSLTLQGLNFAPGAVVAIAPASGGSGQPLAVTASSATSLQVTAPDVTKLPVGRYALRVTNPDATVSDPVTFTISEGAPGQPTATSGKTCFVGGQSISGVVQGAYYYPTSVAHVTGGAFNNSVLDTRCNVGVDATTGQCQGGTLAIAADLTTITNGTFDLTIVNPGPLTSPKTTITIAPSCP